MPSFKYVEGYGVIPSEEADRLRRLMYPRARSDLPAPTLKRFEEYRSPIDGRLITCPKQRRDDLRAHGCVEWEPGINQSSSKGLRTTGEKRQPGWSRRHQRPIKDGLLV